MEVGCCTAIMDLGRLSEESQGEMERGVNVKCVMKIWDKRRKIK